LGAHNLSEPDNVERASQFEELRFAKGQQWYVATAAVTLLSAIFWIERSIRLNRPEKIIATVFIGTIAGFGICFLVKLQHVFSALVGVVALAALVVLYFLWSHHVSAASPP
jgi:hypothetical protein